jgi:hypothetical protein
MWIVSLTGGAISAMPGVRVDGWLASRRMAGAFLKKVYYYYYFSHVEMACGMVKTT